MVEQLIAQIIEDLTCGDGFLSWEFTRMNWDNSQQNTTGGWSTLYTLCLPAVVVFCAATLLILAARATMVTWITVLVLLAFAGKRRRVLVQEGRKITTDVAFYFIKGCA
ncbi:hypothetical protein Patl1_18132 [Pistacia atlantica]|uniref:Uncharacterized protein n=1 Tax=Pistacia atlantica TaxID=434234 RepID=A0ACC1BZL5_9ROSI|nr:hypothetical protein Patl1_18132 [Pistacia atlantica]